MFYMIQYRENGHSSWINGSYQLFNEGISDVSIQGLKPGRNYQFRTLLIDATLETHDPLLTKPTEGRTKCTIGYKGVLQTDNITNTSVSVSWDEENDLGQTECPALGYILEIDENENGYVTNERIFITGKNSYTIENLSPNQTYQINLKKSTVDGESIPVYSSSVTTSGMIDLSKHIIGVTMVMNKSALNINWFPSPIYETFYIKYKLRRHLACEHEEPSSPLQVVTTNQTAYSLDLNDLDANSKYELFVTADLNQNINPQNMSFITLSKVPNALPTLLVDKLKVSHDSVKLYWTDSSQSCQHVNGYFKSYRIELYNKQNMSEHVYVITDNHITVTSLSPNTQYVVRIRFVNHVGASSLYLEHTFTTKQASVLIQDLTAYKTLLEENHKCGTNEENAVNSWIPLTVRNTRRICSANSATAGSTGPRVTDSVVVPDA
uniref:Protein sidekick homolog n=1 Tax=Cacopsylla melanoneura TaxID=428564 RepID=A0A8D8X437_9HEMI